MIFALGGGIAFIIWLKTRKVMLSWNARVYQKGEGVRAASMDADGKTVNTTLRLQDLKPYYLDVLQRIDKRSGTIYKLLKLDKTTNAVSADMVEVWDKQNKTVDVLLDGDTATLLKKGYDATTGSIVFQPMPRERLELVKSEIIIKKDRYQKQKDIWSSVVPWIVIGVAFFSLVGTAYFTGDAMIKVSKMSDAVHQRAAKLQQMQIEAINNINQTSNLGVTIKEPEPPKPPAIE